MPENNDSFEVGLKALTELLDEFRRGNIANKKVVRRSLEQHIAELTRRWDEQFPGFPKTSDYSSFIGLSRREPRNRHLNKIILQQLKSEKSIHGNRVIINPACFLGRRARYLASRLKSFKIIATDINPRFNSFWKHFCKTSANYEYRQDSIFNPKLNVRPSAIVFFG